MWVRVLCHVGLVEVYKPWCQMGQARGFDYDVGKSWGIGMHGLLRLGFIFLVLTISSAGYDNIVLTK